MKGIRSVREILLPYWIALRMMAKYDQAEAAQTAARAFSEKADKGTRSEQIIMAYQTWQKAKAAAEVAKKLSTG